MVFLSLSRRSLLAHSRVLSYDEFDDIAIGAVGTVFPYMELGLMRICNMRPSA